MMTYNKAALIAVLGVTTTLYGCGEASTETVRAQEGTVSETATGTNSTEGVEEGTNSTAIVDLKYYGTGLTGEEEGESTNAFDAVISLLDETTTQCVVEDAGDGTETRSAELVQVCAMFTMIREAYNDQDIWIAPSEANNLTQTVIPINASAVDFESFIAATESDAAKLEQSMLDILEKITARLGELKVEYSAQETQGENNAENGNADNEDVKNDVADTDGTETEGSDPDAPATPNLRLLENPNPEQ